MISLKLPPQFKNSYALSGMIHAVILILLALLTLRPEIAKRWHEIEWEIPPTTIDQEPGRSAPLTNPEPMQAPSTATPSQVVPENATVNPEVKAIPSPVIQTPVLEQPDEANSSVRITRNRNVSDALRNVLPSGPTSGGGDTGFSAALESGSGDAYIISQSIPKISPVVDDEVVVRFRLSEGGTVIMTSLEVISYRQAVHVEALRKEMPSWRFGFRGQYDPQRLYSLRCKFITR